MPAQKLIRLGESSLLISKASNEKLFTSYVRKLSQDDSNKSIKQLGEPKKLYSAYKKARKALDPSAKLAQVVLAKKGSKLYLFFSKGKVTGKNIDSRSGALFRCEKGGEPRQISAGAPRTEAPITERRPSPAPRRSRLPRAFRAMMVERLALLEGLIGPALRLAERGIPHTPTVEELDGLRAQLATWDRRLRSLQKRYDLKDTDDAEVSDRLRALRDRHDRLGPAIEQAARMAGIRAGDDIVEEDDGALDEDFVENEIPEVEQSDGRGIMTREQMDERYRQQREVLREVGDGFEVPWANEELDGEWDSDEEDEEDDSEWDSEEESVEEGDEPLFSRQETQESVDELIRQQSTAMDEELFEDRMGKLERRFARLSALRRGEVEQLMERIGVMQLSEPSEEEAALLRRWRAGCRMQLLRLEDQERRSELLSREGDEAPIIALDSRSIGAHLDRLSRELQRSGPILTAMRDYHQLVGDDVSPREALVRVNAVTAVVGYLNHTGEFQVTDGQELAVSRAVLEAMLRDITRQIEESRRQHEEQEESTEPPTEDHTLLTGPGQLDIEDPHLLAWIDSSGMFGRSQASRLGEMFDALLRAGLVGRIQIFDDQLSMSGIASDPGSTITERWAALSRVFSSASGAEELALDFAYITRDPSMFLDQHI